MCFRYITQLKFGFNKPEIARLEMSLSDGGVFSFGSGGGDTVDGFVTDDGSYKLVGGALGSGANGYLGYFEPIWEFTEVQNWGSASFLSDSLKSGETLPQPSNLESPNGMYKFAFQEDDNLVIYDIYDQVIWSPNTYGQCQDASVELVFQTNGNLELLCGDSKLWESNTTTDGTVCRAVYMQNDGTLAMYNANNQSGVWSSSGSVPIGFGSNNLTSPEILNVGQRLVESYYGQYELSIVAGMLVLSEWQKLGGVKHVLLARPFCFWSSIFSWYLTDIRGYQSISHVTFPQTASPIGVILQV